MFKINYLQIFFLLILGTTVGFIFSYKYFGNDKPKVSKVITQISEKHQKGGKFTSPLLECMGKLQGEDTTTQLNLSRADLSEFIDKIKDTYTIDIFSVYIQDLNNGPWIGINETEEFEGGSLLKVPILISYLKLAEKDPEIMKKVLEYKEKFPQYTQYFSPEKEIEFGKKYAVSELLEYMIYYSDNSATYLLVKELSQEQLNEVFDALGMVDPDPNKSYIVDTKTYSAFFRILYNSSYLNISSSEKALEILSYTEFSKGLQANLLKDIVVSDKFGLISDGNIKQLHDCGIVYHPNYPYLVCIMTRGKNFDDMAESIAQVSKFIYNQVSKNIDI